MRRYVLLRIVSILPTLIGVSIAVFLMVRLIPGTVVDQIIGTEGTYSEETVRALAVVGASRRSGHELAHGAARTSDDPEPPPGDGGADPGRHDRGHAGGRAARDPLRAPREHYPRSHGAHQQPLQPLHPRLLAGDHAHPRRLPLAQLGAARRLREPPRRSRTELRHHGVA